MRLSTVATVLTFVAIPTIASAYAGNNDPNMVHACIGNVSKIVRVVRVSGSCITSGTPFDAGQGANGVPKIRFF